MTFTACRISPPRSRRSPRTCSTARGGGFERARPDGLRLDAVKHVPLDFWARFNGAPELVGRLRLGELLDGDPSEVARTWTKGGFTAMFDFPLGFAIADVFCRGESPAKLAAVLTNDRRYPDPTSLVTLVDNHDLPRIVSVCGKDEAKVAEALTFLLTARGVPSLTWGTEVGLDGEKEPDNRRSMRFVDHPFRALIATWLAARGERASLRDGATLILEATEKKLVVARVAAAEASVVYVNHTGAATTAALLDGQARPDVEPVPVGVTVRTVAGDFSALRARAEREWKGLELREVTFDGEGHVVGSGPELGDWMPEKAVRLPVTLKLPVGGVFEFKRLTREGAAVKWEPGANRLLTVTAGEAPLHVSLAPRG
ncbi:MAG: alpha-amylase family glycosyl hydrolase [Myxococcota bacterium]